MLCFKCIYEDSEGYTNFIYCGAFSKEEAFIKIRDWFGDRLHTIKIVYDIGIGIE